MILLLVIMIASAQTAPTILLSKYSWTAEGNVVGKVHVSGEGTSPKNLSVKGKDANRFTIDKYNTLLIRQQNSREGRMWYDITIEARTATGKISGAFRIVSDAFFSNKVIAHQGAWRNSGAVGNSIASLKQAIVMGAGGTEFDVNMSADSVLFVHHDRNIGDINIEETAAASLSKMKIKNGEYLPTLESYLREGMKQNTTKLVLEIKPSGVSKARAAAAAEKVVELVRKHKAQGWVDYISFDYGACLKVLEMDPFARVAYLNGDMAPADLAKHGFFGIDYNHKVLSEKVEWIKEAHDHNLTVNVWTIDDPQQWEFFLKHGVDFITTDEPEKLLERL